MKISKRIAAVLAAAVMSCTAVAPVSASAATEKPAAKTSASAKTGFSKKNGKYYYYKNGTMVKSSFVKYNDKYYYFLSDGQMATSWVKLDGTYYRFGTDGIMYTGWKKIDNKWYYFGNDGKMRTGTVTIGGKSYNFSSAGVWDGKAGTAVTATSSTTVSTKKSVDYTCTKDDIIAIKGLKEGQYTYNNKKNLLYYRCKFLGKDAITYYYFDNGKLAFYATGILNFNLTENDMQSAYKTLVDSYTKSLGKSVLTYNEIQGEVWQSGKNFVIVAYTNGVVMAMNVSEDYMKALNSGSAALPDFSDI